jgi:hypothetical protein
MHGPTCIFRAGVTPSSLRQRPGLAEEAGDPDVIDDDFETMAGLEDHWADLRADGPGRP